MEAADLFDMALSHAGENPGDTIGAYTLIEPLGEGGFGRVWLASQTEPVRRRVALKILKPGMDSDEILSRFREEWKSLALLAHPGIAQIFDAGITPAGRPFFTMELVEGCPITTYCDEHALGIQERLMLFIKVCHAVQHAHQRGIIHRDLKPSNILVCREDDSHAPRIIDFGTARLLDPSLGDRSFITRIHQIIGTPGYMSPEQAGGNPPEDIDTRTDIYSLGAVLYELLTGTPPLPHDLLGRAALDAALQALRETVPPHPSRRITTLTDPQRETIARQRRLPPERLRHALVGDLDWITLRCLEKDRQRRYDSVGALAGDIRLHLENRPVAARPPDRAYLIGLAFRRNRLAFTLGSVALGALIAAAVISSLFFLRERKSRLQAESLRSESEASRQAANRARASAEDLIDWALDDLRNKLAPLGRLELLENIGGATDAYYRNLPPGERNRESDIRRARVLLLQGDVLYQRNELPKAIGLYQEGISLIEPVLDDDPTLEAKRWHAVLLSRSGDALLGHGKFDEALATRQRHAEVARQLVAARPDDGPAINALCISLRKLAESLDRARQPDAARAALDEAIALSRRHYPGHLKMLLQIRGTWEMRARNYSAAINDFREAIADFEKMAQAVPDRIKDLRYGVQCRISMADCLRFLGRDDEARSEITRALAESERFHRIDPTNHDVQGDIGSARMVSGTLHFKSGNEAAALQDFHECLRIFTDLSRKDPKLIFWQHSFSRLIGDTKPLISVPSPSVGARLLMAEIHLANAECRHAAGKSHEARPQLQACRKWLGELTPTNADPTQLEKLSKRADALESAIGIPAGEDR